MAIEIVTETNYTHPKEVLEDNARDFLLRVLTEYYPEPWEAGLRDNMVRTLRGEETVPANIETEAQ